MRTSATKTFLHDTPKDWGGVEFRDRDVICIVNSVSEMGGEAMQRQCLWSILHNPFSIRTIGARKVIHEETMLELRVS